MKNYWKLLEGRINERNARERVLIAAAGAVVVWMLIDTMLLAPVLAETRRVSLEALSGSEDLVKLTKQLQALALERGADPDSALKARLAELQARQAALKKQIDAQSAELVPPEKMAAVLEKIIASSARLQLAEVKTLPRIAVSLERGAGSAPAAQAGRPASAAEGKRVEVYRHGVEVTMRGSYLDLLAYLRQIEALPVRMFWDKMTLTVTAYPNITLRLVVYTISLEKVWLTV